MPDYPEIFLLRHGQTLWNLEGRYQGQKDSALTARGRAQAGAMGQVLARALDGRAGFRAFTSPQGRARQTAAAALGPAALDPCPDARLREVGFGAWEGLCWDDIARRWPERAALAETEPFLWHFQAPGGERLEEVRARVTAFLDDLTGPAVLVTHGITGRVLRGVWLGLDEYETGGLPGGQGVVFHLAPGQGHRLLAPDSGLS